MKRASLERSEGKTKTNKGLFDHLKKPSKTEEWETIREELKERFAKAGIVSCELRFLGCITSLNFGFGWTFAHSLKRAAISNEPEQRLKDIKEVVYACIKCHDYIEKIGNKTKLDGSLTMADIVRFTISKRKIQP